MQLLSSSQYRRLLPLVRGKVPELYLPSLFAVIEGNARAIVLAERGDFPERALVVVKGGRVFPLGAEDPRFAKETLPELVARYNVRDPLFAISPASPAWQNVLDDCYAAAVTRVHFKYMGGSPAPAAAPAQPQRRIIPVDFRSMAALTRGTNPWLLDRWTDLAMTVSPSFGYCVMINSEIVSAAWAGIVAMGEAELEAVTHPDYLRQGYAEAVCREMLRHCAREGLRPTWSCDLKMRPSIDLAIKLGFTPTARSTAYIWCRQFARPNPKWGMGVSDFKLNPPGAHPAVDITMATNERLKAA